MYYEINVSQHGRHLFATAERSLHTLDELKALRRKLLLAFPEAEGYQITASRQVLNIRDIEFDDTECEIEQFSDVAAAVVHLWRRDPDERRQDFGRKLNNYRHAAINHEIRFLFEIAEILDPDWLG